MLKEAQKGIRSQKRKVIGTSIRTIGVVVTLVVLLLNVLGCSDEQPSDNTKSTGSGTGPAVKGTIVALGDSLTAGLGLAESQAYPALLEKKLISEGYHFEVINAGFSGETSSGTLSRIQWILSTLKPDIIILETGANDGLRGIDPDLLRKNLDQIVSIIKADNIDIILAGMKMFPNLGPEYTPAFSKVYPEIAQKHGIPLIPFFLEGVAGQIQFNQGDRLHPNPEGTLRIVDHIYPYVLESVKKHLTRISQKQGGF
jgi:acyl-CoA thioesterase-1